MSIDTRLLVGTRFPPTVTTKAADALEWIINQQVGVLPHLDDFTITPPLFGLLHDHWPTRLRRNMPNFKEMCAEEETVGSVSCLTLLRIEVDR